MPEARNTSVILDIRPGESIRVSDLVEVRLLRKSGRVSRLRVTAPKDMRIKKEEAEKNEPPDCVTSMA